MKKKLKDEYKNVVMANWTVWPALQLVNFRLVPPPLQMPVMNVGVFFWSTYLAVVSSRSNAEDPVHAGHEEVQVMGISHTDVDIKTHATQKKV